MRGPGVGGDTFCKSRRLRRGGDFSSLGGSPAMIRRLLLVLALAAISCASIRAADAPPNIVFILADDLGINDLSCYGRKDQPTPNLDKLAAGGLRFTTAYCAQPICSPTRAALMTGKTPARLHLTTFLPGRADAPSQRLLHPQIEQQLPLAEQTIAELLKPAGYVSACLGKWHLGGKGFGPENQGFDVVFAPKANTEPSATEGGKGEYGITERAEQFIEENKARPFFLLVSHNSPHVPLGAKPELVAKHADAFNPIYAAMMETLDDSVGRIVAKLDALGLRERTLVIFTSDNGGLHVPELPDTPATHNTPFRGGKGFVYEGGLRIPLIANWPGRIKPGENATPVITTDWVPTFLELAKVEPPATLDGVSLAGLLTESKLLAPRPLMWHFPHYSNQGGRPAGAIIEGEWKLIENYEDGSAELYRLSTDPGERTDMRKLEPGRTAQLRGKLATWRQSVGAQENTPNQSFDPKRHAELYEQVDASLVPAAAKAAEIAAQLKSWRAGMDAAVKKGAEPGIGPVISLPAKSATVHGTNARYEPQPHKNTIGFWTKPEDWVSWDFEVPQAGVYEVEILQGCGNGCGGAEIAISVGEQTIDFASEETGHFQNFIPRKVGKLKLAAGKQTLEFRPKNKRGAAVLDLRQITLLPSAESAK